MDFRPKFRSYRPQDEKLKEQIIEDAKPGNVENEVKDQLEAANSKVVIEELVSIVVFISFRFSTERKYINFLLATYYENLKTKFSTNFFQDISNLAPRKPDWDLKRDLAKKLEKLERRTHKAIAELIRERLKNEITNMDLAACVAVAAETVPKLEN